jgi:hypothetical protein
MPSVPRPADVNTPPKCARIEEELHTKMGCDPFHFVGHRNRGLSWSWQPACQDILEEEFDRSVGGGFFVHCFHDERTDFGGEFDEFVKLVNAEHCEARTTTGDAEGTSVVDKNTTAGTGGVGFVHSNGAVVGLGEDEGEEVLGGERFHG